MAIFILSYINIIIMFDYKFYLNKYEDLVKAGINTEQLALNHWILFGKNEGRICYDEQLEIEMKRQRELELELELELEKEIKGLDIDPLIFIFTRKVTNVITDKYWKECYKCIRELYINEPIYIIDDASTYDIDDDIELINTTIINSEYPGDCSSHTSCD